MIFALILLLLSASALAHDGDSTDAAWFRSLKTPGGRPCCGMEDCQTVQAQLHEGKWQVHLAAGWVDVPPEAILRRENPIGEAVVCIYASRIQCFVPVGAV